MMIGWLTINVWKLTSVTSHHKADTTEFTVHSNTLEKCCDWTVVYTSGGTKSFPIHSLPIYHHQTPFPSQPRELDTGNKEFVKLIWCMDYLVTHLWETLLIWNDLLSNGAEVLCNLVHFGRGTMHTGYVSGRMYKQKWQKNHIFVKISWVCVKAWYKLDKDVCSTWHRRHHTARDL